MADQQDKTAGAPAGKSSRALVLAILGIIVGLLLILLLLRPRGSESGSGQGTPKKSRVTAPAGFSGEPGAGGSRASAAG